MKMIYDVKDKPKAGQVIIFAFQQLLYEKLNVITAIWYVSMVDNKEIL